jgi:hypothetical protein
METITHVANGGIAVEAICRERDHALIIRQAAISFAQRWTVYHVQEVFSDEYPTKATWYREGKKWIETGRYIFADERILNAWLSKQDLKVLAE